MQSGQHELPRDVFSTFLQIFLLLLSLGLVQWHITLVQSSADAQRLCPLCQDSKYYHNLQVSNKI